MELVKSILKHPRFIRFVIASVVVVVVAVLAAHYLGLDWNRVQETLADAWEFTKNNPWALFLAIVILPALPFPMSLLLGAVGVAWNGWPLWQACLVAMLGVALNMTWTYFIAAYPARKLIDRWLKYTKFTIPELGRKDYIGLIFLLRATPGIPLFIHNYILGFLRVPFFVYLPLSIFITSFYVVGIVMTSSSVATAASGSADDSGVWLKIATGIGLLVLAIFITRRIRKHYNGKTNTDTEDKTALMEKDYEAAVTPKTQPTSQHSGSTPKPQWPTSASDHSSSDTASSSDNDDITPKSET